MSAAIYAARYKLKTLVISKEIGGMIVDAHIVENYPGYTKISGMDLMKKFREHVKYFNVEIKEEEVENIEKGFKVYTDKGTYQGKTILLGIGLKRRKLNVKGEEKFIGKGVSYCATCDAPFFKDKTVGVIGGNDAAAMAALLASEYAKKVYIIYRKEKIRAEPYWVDLINKNKKITIINNTNVKEVSGTKFLEKIKLDKPYKNKDELKLDGLFIEIGSVPTKALTQDLKIKTDDKGYIIVNAKQETNVKGVYAAGDITTGSNYFRQVLAAGAEGAIAANSVYVFCKK